MAQTATNEKAFIGYEYKEVMASHDLRNLYMDAYPHFGWELDGTGFMLRFKRNRKIRNKAELTRLCRQFESMALEIESLENSKTKGAMMLSMSVGIVGAAFMAGSAFAIVADSPLVPLAIVLSLPALICWALPYFLYKKGVEKRTAKVAPIIDQKYDEIHDVCEKANGLLAWEA